MKINRFDVVELNDKNKATIRNIQSDGYFVEVVDLNGNSLGTKIISETEINKIIYSNFLDILTKKKIHIT